MNLSLNFVKDYIDLDENLHVTMENVINAITEKTKVITFTIFLKKFIIILVI